jgi:hypothetical protein
VVSYTLGLAFDANAREKKPGQHATTAANTIAEIDVFERMKHRDDMALVLPCIG